MSFVVYRDQYTQKTPASKRHGHKWHRELACLHRYSAKTISIYITARWSMSQHGRSALNTG